MGSKLSEQFVERLKPDTKPFEVRDPQLKGFLVRVQPTGAKTFYCEYRRGQRQKLGRFGVTPVADARMEAMRLLLMVASGEDPGGTARPVRQIVTLRDFLHEQYEPWVRQHHRAADATLYRLRATTSAFLDVKLDKITHAELERWRTQRLRSGAKPATIDRDISALRGALSRAVEWGLLRNHPASKLKMLNESDDGPPRYLDPGEETRLRASLEKREERLVRERRNANRWREARGYPLLPDLGVQPFADRLKPMVLLSMNTGMRRGEVFKLRWRDVDLAQQVLTVRSASAKSKRRRDIFLNAEALATLEAWRGMCDSNTDLVFPGDSGKALTNTKRSWAAVLTDAGINGFRWHDLRHHFASKLAMAGVDLNTIRELLGHSDYKMTLRYAHLAPSHKRKAVELLCAA